MKNKKYIFIGVAFGVFILIAGAAYHFYPNAIKNFFSGGADVDGGMEIDGVSLDTPSDTDMSTPDDGSVPPGVASGTENDSASNGILAEGAPPTDSAGDTASDGSAISHPVREQTSSPSDPSSGNDSAQSITSSSLPLPSPSCAFPGPAPSTTREIIFNEIAWMGSSSSSNAEWIELKNNSANEVALSGWELLNASEKIKIVFSGSDAIPAGGLFLLARAAAGLPNGKIYSGDLVNGGDILALIDPQCNASDYLDALSGWPGGNNTTKQTLERDADDIGWHTSALPGGTPGVENSAGPPPAQFTLTVAFEGDAPGSITSAPAGLACGASCTASYASGTQITLTPVPGNNSAFDGWSGLCYGQVACTFAMTGNISITADFRSTLALPISSDPATDSTGDATIATTTTDDSGDATIASQTSTTTPTSTGADTGAGGNNATSSAGNVLISAVQIAGAVASNDFVKLYNPTSAAIDMSGWKLHKKSETGTDYSLKVFPTGSVIAAGQSFTWANSTGGFSETIGANVSSTETLSPDNSVALMDTSGRIVDAVAWGTGTGQYGEGPPYPTDPGTGQTLVRSSANGVMVNTEDNANDFTLQ
jgi:Lamin Tail Domain/Divergent InlB B-repeat domain